MLKIILLLFIIITISLPSYTSAQVVINEFSSFDNPGDWVEIHNYSSETVDVSNYRIRDSSTTQHVDLSGTIQPQGFYIVDLKDYLNKTGDIIKLIHITNEIEDSEPVEVICYGDKVNDCERIKVGCYPLSGQSIGSYPSDGGNTFERFSRNTMEQTNAGALLDPCPTPTPIPTSTPTSKPTKTPTPIPTSTPTSKPTKMPTLKPTSNLAISRATHESNSYCYEYYC